MISFKDELSTYFSFLVNKSKSILKPILIAAFKPECILCGTTVHQFNAICSPCRGDFPSYEQRCEQCALPLAHSSPHCGECLKENPPFGKTVSAFIYDFPVNRCIQELKYHRKRYLVTPLLCSLGQLIHTSYVEDMRPEVILCVPIHFRKRLSRGFNQSELIGTYLSKSLCVPIDKKSIRKINATQAQTKLDKRQRKRNLRNAFQVKLSKPYKHIALIDDVVTTGATVEYLAKLLKEAGVERVDIWCLARTAKHH